jgi:hypothetical protein
MAKAIVGSMSKWSGLLKDFFRQIDDGSLTLFNLREMLNHRNPFDYLVDIDWRKVYEFLGMIAEYDEFAKTQDDFNGDKSLWIVPVIKGVACNKVVEALKKLDVEFYLYANDLDKTVTINDRDPNRDGSYAIGFIRTAEADEENKNLSANQLKERNHKGITLLERLLLELGYFMVTGQHLDAKNITLCTGSRYSDGDVPDVYWDYVNCEVYVDWCDPDDRYDGLRSRSAVSLPA